MQSSPELAALLVIGDSREHAQLALDSLYAQTIVGSMEIIVVDLKTNDAPQLSVSSRAPTRYATPEREMTWGEGRALAAKLAVAPVLAFIEGHCIAERGWAEALVRAHRQPFVAVGYAFTNPHPETYLSRATLTSKYGSWLHPTTSRVTRVLPAGNVAYKRDELLKFGDDLVNLLTPDSVVHERFNEQRLSMYVESGAIVAHNSLVKLSQLLESSFVFCRILAAKRMEAQRWSRTRRLGYGLATPIVSPCIATWRLFSTQSETPAEWKYLPVVLAKGAACALGESVGYLFGAGSSEMDFVKWELHVARARAA
ncbi:MAG TPA: hypothetical protein VNC11_05055 [Gemmatimonadaceae bacterium]|nr:hypothetical protein [Gemmatimonadaceae bacterium]